MRLRTPFRGVHKRILNFVSIRLARAVKVRGHCGLPFVNHMSVVIIW